MSQPENEKSAASASSAPREAETQKQTQGYGEPQGGQHTQPAQSAPQQYGNQTGYAQSGNQGYGQQNPQAGYGQQGQPGGYNQAYGQHGQSQQGQYGGQYAAPGFANHGQQGPKPAKQASGLLDFDKNLARKFARPIMIIAMVLGGAILLSSLWALITMISSDYYQFGFTEFMAWLFDFVIAGAKAILIVGGARILLEYFVKNTEDKPASETK